MIKRHQVQGKHFNLTRYLKYEKHWGLKSFIICMQPTPLEPVSL